MDVRDEGGDRPPGGGQRSDRGDVRGPECARGGDPADAEPDEPRPRLPGRPDGPFPGGSRAPRVDFEAPRRHEECVRLHRHQRHRCVL